MGSGWEDESEDGDGGCGMGRCGSIEEMLLISVRRSYRSPGDIGLSRAFRLSRPLFPLSTGTNVCRERLQRFERVEYPQP